MKTDIILCGVGGQGILSIATVLGQAATASGLYLKQAEVHGMSQRGGDVQSNLRLSTERIWSDLIPKGQADLIISMEPMEALRYLPYLSSEGRVVTASKPLVNIPDYPDFSAVTAELEALPRVSMLDIEAVALEHVELRVALEREDRRHAGAVGRDRYSGGRAPEAPLCAAVAGCHVHLPDLGGSVLVADVEEGLAAGVPAREHGHLPVGRKLAYVVSVWIADAYLAGHGLSAGLRLAAVEEDDLVHGEALLLAECLAHGVGEPSRRNARGLVVGERRRAADDLAAALRADRAGRAGDSYRSLLRHEEESGELEVLLEAVRKHPVRDLHLHRELCGPHASDVNHRLCARRRCQRQATPECQCSHVLPPVL